MNEEVGHNNLSNLNISNLFHGKNTSIHLLIHILNTKNQLSISVVRSPSVRVFKLYKIPEPPGQFKTKFVHTCIVASMGEAK